MGHPRFLLYLLELVGIRESRRRAETRIHRGGGGVEDALKLTLE